jgi:uncharacterized lipoprotein NlpE involved in copper resistance
MADLSSLYGVGKSAHVVDLRPTQQLLLQEREFNRKRNAEKQAKRAQAQASINSQFEKLKVVGHERDRTYLHDLHNSIQNKMAKNMADHGEMAYVDNPELKRELDEDISFFVRQNETSKSQIANLNKQLERASKNPDDLDPDSLAEFQQWLDLPSHQRLLSPTPFIKDREKTLSEVVEEDLQHEIAKLTKPVEYTGKPDEEGRIVSYKGKQTNKEAYDNLLDKLNKSVNSSVFKKANQEAVASINEDVNPPMILDKDGNEVENPEYMDILNQTRRQLIKEEIDLLKEQDYMTSRATYRAGQAKDKDDVQVTEVTGDEAERVTQEVPETLKRANYLGEIAKNPVTGDLALQLKVPTWRKEDGTLSTEKVFGAEEVPAGTWINKDQQIIDDVSAYKPFRKKKTTKVEREAGVEGSPKKNITSGNVVVDGKVQKITEDNYYEDAEIITYHKGNVYTSPKGEFIREGEKGYKAGKAEPTETVIIRTKKGNTSEVVVNDKIKKDYQKVFNKLGSEYTIDGKGYSKKQLLDMGYTEKQIAPYLTKK